MTCKIRQPVCPPRHGALGAVAVLPWLACLILALSSCAEGDVGAPCNHGSIDAPTALLVTFPEVHCNGLICVYGENRLPASERCRETSDCNNVGGPQSFECDLPGDGSDEAGWCRLTLRHVLERSMCSMTCETAQECGDFAVAAADTSCKTGFACVMVQSLGDLCCQNMCVCSDDLSDADVVGEACHSGTSMCKNSL